MDEDREVKRRFFTCSRKSKDSGVSVELRFVLFFFAVWMIDMRRIKEGEVRLDVRVCASVCVRPFNVSGRRFKG